MGFWRRASSSLVDVEELFAPVFAEHSNMQVGWPDDEVSVRVRDPQELRDGFRAGLAKFCALWRGTEILADLDVSIEHRRLDVRVARIAKGLNEIGPDYEARTAPARNALDQWIPPLQQLASRSNGDAHRGYDGSYFGLSLPVEVVGAVIGLREDFPALDEPDWDARYRAKLARTSWSSLRGEVFRFCDLATRVAEWAVGRNAQRVLIPSVGLCVHPWLFAERSLSVVATDISPTALETLKRPEQLPRMYGRRAKERWDISEAAVYGGGHPHRFERMPDLGDAEMAAQLRERIDFAVADWVDVPLEDASVDVVFATNALPREDGRLRRRVLAEWARVIRPQGLVFSAMHNAYGASGSAYYQSLGWKRVSTLQGEVGDGRTPVFDEYLSSG